MVPLVTCFLCACACARKIYVLRPMLILIPFVSIPHFGVIKNRLGHVNEFKFNFGELEKTNKHQIKNQHFEVVRVQIFLIKWIAYCYLGHASCALSVFLLDAV